MAVLPPDPVFSLRNADMGPANCICFHQSERLFCGTAKGSVYLWDLQTNRSPLHFNVGTAPLTSIHHLDETLLTQQKGGRVQSWKVTNSGYQLTSTIDTEHTGFCRFECALDENFIISPKNENDIVLLKKSDVDQVILTLKYDYNNSSSSSGGGNGGGGGDASSNSNFGQLMCFKLINRSGQLYLLAGYESGDFLTWDFRAAKVAVDQKRYEECPMAIDYDSITNRGIFGGPSDQLSVFQFTGGMEMMKVREISLKNPGINCLSIRRDQKVFAAGGWDGRIRIFSWKSLRPLAVLTEHKAAVVDISYSDDKVALWKAPIMAASGLDGQITLWDLYN